MTYKKVSQPKLYLIWPTPNQHFLHHSWYLAWKAIHFSPIFPDTMIFTHLHSCHAEIHEKNNFCTPSTDIEKRSIPPHVMALSVMESQLGIQVLLISHTQKQTQHFMLRPQYIRTWPIKVILTKGKTQILPIWATCQDKDGAGSGISGLYLWSHQNIHQFDLTKKLYPDLTQPKNIITNVIRPWSGIIRSRTSQGIKRPCRFLV